jgi:alkylation response protein AidB-like acyl-CoA dehydrogenase
VVTGRWPYASGSGHSTWLAGFCNTFDGETLRQSMMGPEVRVCAVPKSEAKVVDTWKVMGLCGTGSNDIVLESKFVPARQTAVMGPGQAGKHFKSALYRYPFLALFGSPIATTGLGIASGAIDGLIEVARTKISAGTTGALNQRPMFQVLLADAVAVQSSARAWLFQELESAWEKVEGGQPVPVADRARIQLASAHATRSAAQATELVYRAAGGSANYRSSPLQRALRDVNALTQHAGTSPHQLPGMAAILAGLPPDNPMLLL